MIRDVRYIQDSAEFAQIAKNFKDNNETDWKIFKAEFLKLFHFRCPICDIEMREFAHVDHYRPKALYDFLTYDSENYLLMCPSCNTTKKDKFPLDDDTKKANTKEKLKDETPLLINPRYDNVYDYFILDYEKCSKNGEGYLKIKPKYKEDTLEYKKAQKTIEIYNLDNLSKCGIEHIQTTRYNDFEGYLMKYLEYKRNKNDEAINELDKEYDYSYFIYYIQNKAYDKTKMQELVKLIEAKKS